MINARKSISLSWKARNGQRSANPWRRRRRKERSWQNTVRERRSLFSRRRKEPESPDQKIYKMLEALEFTFGGNTYKVAEAGLMFAYEIGMENGRIYVVALSENFWTIIFYIPEETAEKIKERVQELPCSFRSYLHFLIEYKEFEKFLGPAKYYGVSIKEAADALALALNAGAMAVQDAAGSLAALAAAAYDENIQEPAPVPNNWLKIHGLPMRRKGKGKKKK